MQNITRTAYGSALQTTLFDGIPFDLIPFTTLNENFNVLSGQAPAAGVIPKATYFCIGNGGHQLATGTGGVALIEEVPHLATDAGLYSYLPFILRAINNDIPAGTQAAYALRKQITVAGQQYFAYYLKRIPTNASVIGLTLETVNNGTTTSVAFTPTAANLTPTPPVINNTGVNVLTSQYVNVSATMPMVFTQQECTELLNAATILYGDPAYAIISEMGICSGVDYPITLSTGVTFIEAIAVQICSFINTMHVIQYTATGITGSYQVGSNDPLLVLQPQA